MFRASAGAIGIFASALRPAGVLGVLVESMKVSRETLSRYSRGGHGCGVSFDMPCGYYYKTRSWRTFSLQVLSNSMDRFVQPQIFVYILISLVKRGCRAPMPSKGKQIFGAVRNGPSNCKPLEWSITEWIAPNLFIGVNSAQVWSNLRRQSSCSHSMEAGPSIDALPGLSAVTTAEGLAPAFACTVSVGGNP